MANSFCDSELFTTLRTAKSDDGKLIPLESLGRYQIFDPPLESIKLPAFEAPYPEAFAEKYRHQKLKQRKEKLRKRRRAEEEPLEKGEISDYPFVREPRNDPDFDPSNPLGL